MDTENGFALEIPSRKPVVGHQFADDRKIHFKFFHWSLLTDYENLQEAPGGDIFCFQGFISIPPVPKSVVVEYH